MIRLKNKKLKLNWVVCLTLTALIMGSCVPYKKQVYFQFLEDLPKDSFVEFNQLRTDYKLQVDDIIDISITSPNAEMAAFFSQTFSSGSSLNAQMMQASGGSGDLYYLTGYIVDDSGYIELPVLGKIPIKGSSTAEVKKYLEDELLNYFNSKNSFNVKVKIGGIRFSIMGEVLRPGRYVVLESRYTIYQALAQVGDLGPFANRSEVWLIRQVDGKARMFKVDLLGADVMESEAYYIQPNDIIYVRPLKAKQYGVGSTFLQNFNATVSVISASLSLYLSYKILTDK